ncbi:general stress protein [Salsuginibacillus kocurii]|uniref:general stress protein n=1 Tax=Salsuginibacillus kocurii TaxID=427078 RepID=UPI0003616A1C|nr:general stress protein [Salsuginibacillus kocurii]
MSENVSLPYQEFYHDDDVIAKVKELKEHGVNEEDIFILSHDPERTEALAVNAQANHMFEGQQPFWTTFKNIFRNRRDELQGKLETLGFDGGEADQLEEKLNEGNVLIVISDKEANVSMSGNIT